MCRCVSEMESAFRKQCACGNNYTYHQLERFGTIPLCNVLESKFCLLGSANKCDITFCLTHHSINSNTAPITSINSNRSPDLARVWAVPGT